MVLIEPGARYSNTVRCEGGRDSVQLDGGTMEGWVRVLVTEEDPREFLRCFDYSPPQGCDAVEPRAATVPGVTFGVKVYEELQGPVAVRMRGIELPARTAWRAATYSLSTVAAGASGAPELTFEVDPSERERIAQATLRYTRTFERCMERTRDFVECIPTVELLVDGQPVEDQQEGPFDGRAGWGPLAADDEHVVTFRVVEGDPRHVDLVVKVYEED